MQISISLEVNQFGFLLFEQEGKQLLVQKNLDAGK
jgi:hypothetical protein